MNDDAFTITKVIVIGSADVIKLCAIRAVGEFGCHVDAIHMVDDCKKRVEPIDRYSRYIDNYFFVDKAKEGSLTQFLLDNYTNSKEKLIIITLDDYSTFIIDKSRDILGERFLFAHSGNEGGLTELMNKNLMKVLAKESGLNVVEGWPILFENGDYKIPGGIKYPCFIKGLYSYNISKTIQKRCDSEEELVSFLNLCKRQFPHSVYAEEFIQIDKEFGVIGVCDGDKSIIPAEAELLVLGQGANHGVSMLGQIKPLDSNNVLCQSIECLLSKLHYVGIFNVDFVESNGRVFFVELNFRFAAYGYGLMRAGVNLPALFINVITNAFNKDIRTQLDGEYYYMNEMIALINLINGSISMAEYKAMKRKADFLMVSDKNDSKPQRFFAKRYFMRYLKSRLKKIKKCNNS